MKKKNGFHGWVCFLGLYLSMGSTIGSFLTFTILMSTYMEAFQTNITTVSLLNVAAMIMSIFISLFMFNRVFGKLGPKKTFIFGGIIIFLAMLMCSRSQSIYFSIFAYFLFGMPVALCEQAGGTATITLWFKDKINVVTSILFSSLTAGPMVYLFVTSRLVSILGWRNGVMTVGVIAGGIVIFSGLFLIKDAPERYGQHPYGYREDEIVGAKQERPEEFSGPDPRTTHIYWLLYLIILGIAMFSNAFSCCVPTYLQFLGMDIVVSSNYTTVYNAIGIVIMFVSGFFIEKFGFRSFITGCIACGIGYLMILTVLGNLPSTGIMILICVLAAISVSGGSLVASLSIAPIFGQEYVGILVSGLMSAFMLGCTVMPTAFGIIVDALGYKTAWLSLAVTGIVSLILFFIVSGKKAVKKI